MTEGTSMQIRLIAVYASFGMNRDCFVASLPRNDRKSFRRSDGFSSVGSGVPDAPKNGNDGKRESPVQDCTGEKNQSISLRVFRH